MQYVPLLGTAALPQQRSTGALQYLYCGQSQRLISGVSVPRLSAWISHRQQLRVPLTDGFDADPIQAVPHNLE